jgi:hypothetical protein
VDLAAEPTAGNPERPDRPRRTVVVRPVERTDRWWLTRAGLAPEMAGVQYHWAEIPLQLLIAPARPSALCSGPRCVIEVDGERAGYVGRNPLSGNLEYFLKPWARGGTGVDAIAAFLRDHREGDGPRAFSISSENTRSRTALDRAFARLGWRDGYEFTTRAVRFGVQITVGSGRAPGATERGRMTGSEGENGA